MAIRKGVLAYAKKMAEQSAAFRNFKRGINSLATETDYTNYLQNFMKFHNFGDDFDKVVKLSMAEIDDLFTSYLDSMEARGVKPSTMRSHLMGIERLFIMNDALWHKDRIRKGIKKDDSEPGGKVAVTTDELYRMLEATKVLRTKLMVHFLADTGMRPAGLTDPVLRIKHLIELKTKGISVWNVTQADEADKCYGIKIYDGSKSGYWAFLTPETTQLLNRYFQQREAKGEHLTKESTIFKTVRNSDIFHENITADYARVIINNLIIAAGIKRVKISKHRFDKATMYMFRKRFNTILKINNDVNSNIAEKLMAHKKGLDGTYLQPTMEECFAEFEKAIPELTIDPTVRQELQIKAQQQEITLLETKSRRIDVLESQLQKVSNELKTKQSIEPSPEMIKKVLLILKQQKSI